MAEEGSAWHGRNGTPVPINGKRDIVRCRGETEDVYRNSLLLIIDR
jgi:hypothetical protein